MNENTEGHTQVWMFYRRKEVMITIDEIEKYISTFSKGSYDPERKKVHFQLQRIKTLWDIWQQNMQ